MMFFPRWITQNSQYLKQKEGTAQPSIAASFIEKLQDETSPNFTSEERLARNTCAAAFAGEL